MKGIALAVFLIILNTACLKGFDAFKKANVITPTSTAGTFSDFSPTNVTIESTTAVQLNNYLDVPTTKDGYVGNDFNTVTTNITEQNKANVHAFHKFHLEEKLRSLSCNLPIICRDSRVWKGNETHELLLPIKKYTNCDRSNAQSENLNATPVNNCYSNDLSWEGSIEIQSGDVLLVRIDDSKLLAEEVTNYTEDGNLLVERIIHEPSTAVYQVTRAGHDHCDVTEGILLDITPLKVENRKVVTLYDKDLTEGTNLLIVVSKSWGSRCIRLKVMVKSDNCGDNEDCTLKGICYSNTSMEGYECQCCFGFIGQHCEEQDACYSTPCKNNGICVDISQGHEGSAFQCLCPYGYTGKTCEEETNLCTSMPCQNGATCHGNVTRFRCECQHGFFGPLCQHNINECDSSPCVHGICVDQENGYKCFCKPGYTGDQCEYQFNECESAPCINGGVCRDDVSSYYCTCGKGYAGKRCEIKIDLCQPNPCPIHRYCLDNGNNYTCECPSGFSGVNCESPYRTACSINPCVNGGTCWSSMDSFYCACRPGFTGTTCNDEFIVKMISNSDIIFENNESDLQVPIPVHLDHLHSVYIAAGTLACAFVIVALVVTVCHCRMNKTYKKFKIARSTFSICKICQPPKPPLPTKNEWFSGKNKAPTATPCRNLPSLDTTDMYYTLDFSDSQSSPLIQ